MRSTFPRDNIPYSSVFKFYVAHFSPINVNASLVKIKLCSLCRELRSPLFIGVYEEKIL